MIIMKKVLAYNRCDSAAASASSGASSADASAAASASSGASSADASAAASASSGASSADASAATSASLETPSAIEQGTDHLHIDPQTITLETFKELSKEVKYQLTKIWTEQFIESKQLPTTDDKFLCLDLRLLNTQQQNTFFEMLKDNKGIVHLRLLNCQNLTNVKALQSLTKLQSLFLHGCQNLNNLDPLQSLTKLQSLHLSGCNNLINIEALQSLTKLQSLNLHGCQNLNNLDPLQSLTKLQSLNLSGCHKLTNLEALQSLTEVTVVIFTRV